MTSIIIKEYNRLLDHAKEELANDPGNYQIKYHFLALINELMVVAVELGLISEEEKELEGIKAIKELI